MKRVPASNVLYVLVIFSLLFVQASFAARVSQVFDSPLAAPLSTPSTFDSPLPTPTLPPATLSPETATATPVISPTLPVAGATPTAIVTPGATPVLTHEVTTIMPEGGEVSLQERHVRLQIPRGAVTETVKVQARALGKPAGLPANLYQVYEFVARNPQQHVLHSFARPFTLTLQYDADQFLPDLIYLQDAGSGKWQPLPTLVDERTRTLTASVPHLSQLASGDGVVPNVLPTLTGIQNDRFSGAATIEQVIPLPPGAGGFVPKLALQFNSRSRAEDQGNTSVLGTGWQLTTDSWVATGWLLGDQSLPTTWRIDGVNYTEANGTFREAPDWRVGRENSVADAYAPDGRHYHFARAYVDFKSDESQPTAKWLLDYVTDASGNKIQWHYQVPIPVDPLNVNWSVHEHPSNYEPDGIRLWREYNVGGSSKGYLFQNNVTRISYNTTIPNDPEQTQIRFFYASRVDFPGKPMVNGDPSTGDPCTPTEPDANNKQYFYSDRLLVGIEITQLRDDRTGYSVMAGYKLDYDQNSPSGWFGGQECPRASRSALKALTQCKPLDDSGHLDPNLCLPPFTLTNSGMPMDENGRVYGANNGSGGQVGFTYDSLWPWLVTGRTVTNLGQVDTWSYSYASGVTDTYWGEPVGFQDVTETLPASLGADRTVVHHFLDGNRSDNLGLRGKEDRVETREGNLLQAQTLRNWLSTASGVHGGINLVTLDYEEQRTYQANGVDYQAQRTQYYYDLDDHNGTVQYGNPTRILEYSDAGSTLYRTRERWYVPRENTPAGQYLVHALAQEKLWQGNIGSGTCESATRYSYDGYGQTQYSQPPTRGLLTEVWRAGYRETWKGDQPGTSCDADWVRTLDNSYDAWGNLASQTAPNGTLKTTNYEGTRHAYALVETVQPPAGQGATLATYYQYYGFNDQDCPGQCGQLHWVTDANGQSTSYTYDVFHRLTDLRRPGADASSPASEKYAYTNYASSSAPFEVQHSLRDDANGDASPAASYHEQWSFYDGAGRLIQAQDEGESADQAIAVSTSYTALDQVAAETLPYAIGSPGAYQTPTLSQLPRTQYSYDALGRLTSVTNPDNSQVHTSYDGLQTAVRDEKNHQTVSQRDVFGRLSASKQYSGTFSSANFTAPPYIQVTYAYNAADQLTDVWQDQNHTQISYDLLGHRRSLSDPDMGAWLYAYDALGNLMSQSDAIVPAQTTCYGYDGHDRLISKVYQVGNAVCSGSTAQVSYSYDQGANGLGRRTGMSDATGDTAWSYDARGRLESETKWLEGQVFTSGYGYRSDDQLASVTDPDGEVVTTGYNSRGLAISLSGSIPEGGVLASSTYISPTTGYTPLGQISQLSYGNGLNANYTYHPQSARLTALAAPGLLDQHYEYEAVGNLKTITDTVSGLPQVTQFQYDDLDRLSAASGAYSAGYLYAPNGNLLAKREGSQRLDLAYPPAGQAHPHAPAAVTGQLSFSPEYDQNGNLQSGGGRTLTYDEEHRLTQVVSGTQVTRFAYDGDGRLVKRSAPDGRETLYVNPSFEVTILTVEPPAPPPIPHPERKLYLPYVVIAAPAISCGTPINGKLIEFTKYYWFNAQRIAQRQPCGGELLYLYHDHLGSTLATDQGEGGRYWPFGGLRSGSLNATPYRFTGQREDSYINLYLMGSRWYDSYLNRWIQPDSIVPDPTNPQALNRYSYCLNNPLRFTDPDGRIPVPLITGGVGALVAGGVDLGKQLIVDHKHIRDVNWAEAGGAAAGGFVAGATLGLAPAGASVVGLTLLGGVSSGAGGQVQAVTQAGLERLMGRTQASVLADAKNLGFLDPKSIVIDTGAGMVMGGAGGKFAGWLRNKLPLPESAAVIQRSGELPMVRWVPQLDKPGIWTVQMEGRTISIDANVFEIMVRSATIGGYDAAEKILTEAIQQGTVTIIKDKAQP